ncbi:PAS domain S-box-containing protein [Natronincola peptidivorans]|uniref:histidine kinase n=1 Tax=Natronincola peptidivorans TaxID=426128 RepID=A0A1H9ZLV4_9FIRM|nr:HAMP domain-containing sensor histidine kinase [Natronincola peptidivorans]SES82693.1 PAS domain S-box-containing protein [Natronincola peptidivorans]
MRIDIENKILIPFMILLILSIITLGIVSYWNGYQLLLENETKNLSMHLEEMIFFIEDVAESVEDGGLTEEEGKAAVLDYYQRQEKENLVIFDGERLLFNKFHVDDDRTKEFLEEALDGEEATLPIGNDILIYKSYDPWGWIIGYGLNKGLFSYEVLESQKYMILVAIISLIFSMQAAIVISHNISKPIKMLADLCDKIAQGSFNEKIEIKRKDEIGMLANAFNNMVYRLQEKTTKLIEITQLNEDILRNIATGIITTDQQGRILSINQAAKELLVEYKEKDGQKYIEKKLLNQVKETLSSSKNINHVEIFDHVDEGNKIYLDVTTSLLKTDEGFVSGAICSFNDISERKKIENNMETLDRLTSIGQLAAGIAHEIRNPLAGMKTSIQVLKNRLCKEEGQANEKLFNGVLYEIDRINHLITDILDFAKPRTPKYEKTDLLMILNRALDLVKKTAEENHIKIYLENRCSRPLVFVDSAQIEQVFLNIIKNALKAVEKNGTLKIILDVHRQEKASFVTMEFHDNGCGIEPDNLEKIFDPFFTTSPQGTGLGLSVVYELVKGNRGKMDVHSTVDVGTKFKIKFPLYGGGDHEEKNIDC